MKIRKKKKEREKENIKISLLLGNYRNSYDKP